MSKSSKHAPKQATVSFTAFGKTYTATAATRNEALAALYALVEREAQ